MIPICKIVFLISLASSNSFASILNRQFSENSLFFDHKPNIKEIAQNKSPSSTKVKVSITLHSNVGTGSPKAGPNSALELGNWVPKFQYQLEQGGSVHPEGNCSLPPTANTTSTVCPSSTTPCRSTTVACSTLPASFPPMNMTPPPILIPSLSHSIMTTTNLTCATSLMSTTPIVLASSSSICHLPSTTSCLSSTTATPTPHCPASLSSIASTTCPHTAAPQPAFASVKAPWPNVVRAIKLLNSAIESGYIGRVKTYVETTTTNNRQSCPYLQKATGSTPCSQGTPSQPPLAQGSTCNANTPPAGQGLPSSGGTPSPCHGPPSNGSTPPPCQGPPSNGHAPPAGQVPPSNGHAPPAGQGPPSNGSAHPCQVPPSNGHAPPAGQGPPNGHTPPAGQGPPSNGNTPPAGQSPTVPPCQATLKTTPCALETTTLCTLKTTPPCAQPTTTPCAQETTPPCSPSNEILNIARYTFIFDFRKR